MAASVAVKTRKVAESAANGSKTEIRVAGYTIQVNGEKTQAADAFTEVGEGKREAAVRPGRATHHAG